MVRIQAQPDPPFLAKDILPILPMAGLCVLAITVGLVIYFFAGQAGADRPMGDTAVESETISVAPPSFVFEGDQQGQIYFSSDPHW